MPLTRQNIAAHPPAAPRPPRQIRGNRAHRRRLRRVLLDDPRQSRTIAGIEPGRWGAELPFADNGKMTVLRRFRLIGEDRNFTIACYRRSAVSAGLAMMLCLGAGSSALAAQRFQADEWITECGGRPGGGASDCSITVPFWQDAYAGKGSFALVVMLRTGNIGIVGSPLPVKAVLRVDKNPAAICRGSRYCIFPTAQSVELVRQLETGSLILIDVFTAKSQFSFSLSPKGYQAGVAQIRAWGYQISAN